MWLGVLAIAGLAVYVLFDPVQTWFGQQQRIAQLTEDVKKSEAAVAAVTADIERWNDAAYVEAQARQRLLYVYPGDVTYLIVNDVVAEEVDAPIATETVRSTDINWVDALQPNATFSSCRTNSAVRCVTWLEWRRGVCAEPPLWCLRNHDCPTDHHFRRSTI